MPRPSLPDDPPSQSAPPVPDSEPTVQLPLLEVPADGIPPVTDTADALRAAILALGNGTGPVALDSERAQGYRYGADAWLIQLRRQGAGTFLVDPVAFGQPADLSELNAVIEDAEWVLHAATQDLPCLRQVGLYPRRLFDTELAGRLLNMSRVGLGALIEQEFGVRLRKEHSAADWSSRPLPRDWLAYAALDVELLVELRDRLAEQLAAAGRLEWAEQEFAAIVTAFDAEPAERLDPWRRTAGLHALKTPAQLALVRALWLERDAIARKLDRGPGRILPDAAITAAAALVDTRSGRWPGAADLRQIDGFKRRNARRFEANWLAAIAAAADLRRTDYPPRHMALQGPPHQPRSWEARHPEEYRRWLALRPAVNRVAEEVGIPPENLLSPATLREVAWQPPVPEVALVGASLRALGARPWQVSLVAEAIATALRSAAEAAATD